MGWSDDLRSRRNAISMGYAANRRCRPAGPIARNSWMALAAMSALSEHARCSGVSAAADGTNGTDGTGASSAALLRSDSHALPATETRIVRVMSAFNMCLLASFPLTRYRDTGARCVNGG